VSDDRDLILARVRAGAASRRPAPEESIASGADQAAAGTWTTDELLRSFARMSEDAQAPVAVVENFTQARLRVSTILARYGVRSVVVGPDAAGDPWSCAEALTAAGLSVVVRKPGAARAAVLSAEAGVTAARGGLADTGTLVLVASPGDHRLDSLLPPVHVALLRASSLVPDLAAFCRWMGRDRLLDAHSAIVLVRGPSRTADIELTLTVGVHGPGETFVIVVNDARGPEAP
jgi:L-lactate dehydrogenase complex protein LldG